MLKDINYKELDKYLPVGGNEEYYALLTHFLQMENGDKKQEKKDELIKKFGFTEQSLSEAKDFFDKKNVRFKCSEYPPKFTFIDLFAGIGGFRLAMQDCGGKCVFSSEWDEAAKQTYYENYGEVPFGDITKQEIKNLIPRDFDVLCAGFPCQAFSIAGYQKGFDDVRGTLFFDIANILEKYKPKAFYLENVKNLKSHNNGKTFEKIMNILQNRLNYRVFIKVMNPCEYANIPQNRERIFIIGFNPEKLPLSDDFIFEFPKRKKLTRTIKDVIDETENDKNLFYMPEHKYYSQMKEIITNRDTVYQWRRIYIRENKSGLCPTLTANMGEGGHNVPIICVPQGIRKLSPKECLGFQGFPENYKFPDSIAISKKYKQAGNSVTEPLIYLVAKKLINIVSTQEK